jgi:hypothetical protein
VSATTLPRGLLTAGGVGFPRLFDTAREANRGESTGPVRAAPSSGTLAVMRSVHIGLAFVAAITIACSKSEGSAVDLGTIDSGATTTDSGCAAGQESCDGKCVNVAIDRFNCGTCGVSCAGAALCCASRCVDTADCSFSVSGVSPAGGWQNGGDYLTLTGDGFTAGMKVFIGDGRAPVLVLNANNARIQTPPGPLGPADVKIELAGKTSVLRNGFSYAEGALAGPWAQKPMSKVRGEDPGVAVMQDGRVLVAGGTTVPDSTADALETAEVYTRETDKVTAVSNSMGTPRWQNTAITLLDGRVLVVGGACHMGLTSCKAGSDPTAADLFDPKTNSFAPTKSPLNVGRSYTRAALLVDGKVLISSANDDSLEIFDPVAETFVKITHSPRHVFGFMVRLRDGRVMLGGGDGGTKNVELFDPDTKTFAPTGSLVQGRSKLTAHTLPDGRVLVIGGASISAGSVTVPLDTIEAFDPKTEMWSTMPYRMSAGRCWHASALVRDGTILAMGGYSVNGSCTPNDTVDQIDPVKAVSTPFAKLPNTNTEWQAVTLLDGSVLGVGGGACGTPTALPDLDFLPSKAGPK